MKLLFDENLSHKLVSSLADIFPESTHVRDIGMKSADDPEVWDYARANGFIIVSKDADMHDLSLLKGNPPKVIWIQLGNCSTSQTEQRLRKQCDQITEFAKDETSSLYALNS